MAAPDTTAPNLSGLNLPASIDVTGGARDIMFSASALDSGSGVDRVLLFFDRSWQQDGFLRSSISFFDNMDSFGDGSSDLSVRFDPTTAAGTYAISSALVYDKAGNTIQYSGAQLAGMGLRTSFQVTSNSPPDTVAPSLSGTSLPASVDVTSAAQVVTFSASALDSGSGVDRVLLFFDRSWQQDGFLRSSIGFYDNADSFADGMSALSVRFDQTTAAGTYSISSAVVYDKAGNTVQYSGAQLAGMGFRTSFEITSSSPPDTVAPSLSGLLLPASVDVTGGVREVTFSTGALDSGSGVDRVLLFFDRSWQQDGFLRSSISFFDNADSFADGASDASVRFDPTTAAGTYSISSAMVYDKAGNITQYSAAQLAGMGLQTSFHVVDRQVSPTAFVTAPDALFEDRTATGNVSVTLLNVAQASGTISMSFAASGSTAQNGVDVDVPNYSASYSVAQSPAGSYMLQLPSITVLKDAVAEGTEYVTITIRASGRIFDTGTDTTTVTVRIIDSGQTGTASNDTLTGTQFGDHLSGLAGNDTLIGGPGNDVLDGGAGMDTAVYSGLFRSYQVQLKGAAGLVAGGAEGGTDTLTSIELVKFKDGTFVFDANGVAAQVTRLYDTVLRRAPDQAGLDLWVDQIEDRGGTLKDVARGFLNSPEFQARTGNLSNADYVEFLYVNALGRASDPGGKAYWVEQLSIGADRADLLIGFSESQEHRNLTAEIVSKGFFNTDDAYQAISLIYDSFAGRKPDAGGLIYWAELLKSGAASLDQIADGFAASPEFRNLIAGKSNADLVEFMYNNTLDRGSDPGGKAHWISRLESGMDHGDLLIGFSQSTEHFFMLGSSITNGIDYY